MLFTHKFIVTTHPGGPGGYDHGHWTGHPTKQDAVDAARRVEGYAYKVKATVNGYKVAPIEVDRG